MEVATKIFTHPAAVITVNALAVVASMAPIPGADSIPGLVQSLQGKLRHSKTRKEDCAALAETLDRLMDVFEKQQKEVRQTNLSSAASEVIVLLENISRRVDRWQAMGSFKALLKVDDIKDGLADCRQKVDDAIKHFSLLNGIETANGVARIEEKLDKIAERYRLEAMSIVSEVVQAKETRATNVEEWERVYERMDAVYENLLGNSTKEDADLKLGNTPVPRAYYNTLVLLVQKTLKDLHSNLQSYRIPDLGRKVALLEHNAFEGGHFTDLYRGKLVTEDKFVVIKTVRGIETIAEKAVLRFNNEIKVWAHLRHPNVHQIYGYTTQCGLRYVGLVSAYCRRRNILRFVNGYKSGAHKLQLLKNAAAGMEYLHKKRVVHGNLKSSNILITDDKVAVISDFQMSKVMLEAATDQGLAKQTYTRQPSPRWTAPELSTSMVVPSFKADVWAFGMVMVEVFTGLRPFHEFRRDTAVVVHVAQGGRPDRPDDPQWMTDDIWQLMQDCWRLDPAQRPSFTEIRERLEEAEELYDRTTAHEVEPMDHYSVLSQFDRFWGEHDVVVEGEGKAKKATNQRPVDVWHLDPPDGCGPQPLDI